MSPGRAGFILGFEQLIDNWKVWGNWLQGGLPVEDRRGPQNRVAFVIK